eukprot:TRINITY_DN6994_c0_g2_i1.p1 TRINITY_DN6994_c0_g2~~TRINITY_DN6994_c0_g2_i1.p1  ORF type:complete len:103 (+),score=16.01 TRINITY_DN6994_c0_g2_i1:84-392(+)
MMFVGLRVTAIEDVLRSKSGDPVTSSLELVQGMLSIERPTPLQSSKDSIQTNNSHGSDNKLLMNLLAAYAVAVPVGLMLQVNQLCVCHADVPPNSWFETCSP